MNGIDYAIFFVGLFGIMLQALSYVGYLVIFGVLSGVFTEFSSDQLCNKSLPDSFINNTTTLSSIYMHNVDDSNHLSSLGFDLIEICFEKVSYLNRFFNSDRN